MSGLDDRASAFENKFAHDEEMLFKATARRNKLLGDWAAEKLGVSGNEAKDYAKSVVRSDFDEPGDEDVYRKVKGDFEAASVDVSESELRSQMTSLLVTAKEQIANEA